MNNIINLYATKEEKERLQDKSAEFVARVSAVYVYRKQQIEALDKRCERIINKIMLSVITSSDSKK